MWRVSTAPVAASASIGVKRKKFWLLTSVMCTGRSPAHRLATSSAAVTPAKPPPRIRIRGASDVDGRASTRPPARIADIVTGALDAGSTGPASAVGIVGSGVRSELAPGAQCLRHAPGLRDAAVRAERRLGLEDLGDAAQPVIRQMLRHRREEGARGLPVAVHAVVRERERSEQPGPRGALVVRTVALPRAARVPRLIARLARGQAAEP